ncbi:protein DGCR6 isoform X1 [Ranitomeya imitator]|uniref:protein DGCR6 isoform X1 n=1 Tax=Ranitomeya imitator TaxID=111125 RepID=UPI0037E89568
MGSRSTGVQTNSGPVGIARNRSIRNEREQADQEVRFSSGGGQALYNRLPSNTLEFSSSLRVPSNVSDPVSPQEDQGGQGESDPDCPLLAQEGMVLVTQGNVCVRPLGTADQPGASFSGSIQLPQCGIPASDGVEFERELLRRRGFSEALISTLLNSRKEVTTKIYAKTWKKFLAFYQNPFSGKVPIPAILEFLQKGRELGLAVNTLRVQVSALGALYNSDVAGNRWVSRFIRATERSKPVYIPRLPPCDLNLVLDALTEAPFEPMIVSIKNLTLKTAFLVALTSARRVSDLQALSIDPPYLMVFQDRVVLKPDPAYLPKVASKFHRSQEIILPSFCDSPNSADEQKYHMLDVRRTLLEYLHRTEPWRQSRALFVSFQNPRKGASVTKASIARWIRDAIYLAYTAKGQTPPDGIRAHSTRAMASSWAERADVSIDVICS